MLVAPYILDWGCETRFLLCKRLPLTELNIPVYVARFARIPTILSGLNNRFGLSSSHSLIFSRHPSSQIHFRLIIPLFNASLAPILARLNSQLSDGACTQYSPQAVQHPRPRPWPRASSPLWSWRIVDGLTNCLQPFDTTAVNQWCRVFVDALSKR